MMELKNDHEEQKLVSVLQGDEHCISRILAREPSLGGSSRIFYRPSDGVPFKWEMNPGTPKNPQEEDRIPPPSPSPLMQSLGLPLPNMDGVDHDRGTKESASKRSIISNSRKMAKTNIINGISKKVGVLGKWRSYHKKQESSRFGDSNGVGSVKSSSLSSISSFSSNSRALDVSTIDGPFCYNPLEIHAILDEGNTKEYYCSHQKTVFEVEKDDSFHSIILSRISASDHFSGPLENEETPARIPFLWETQPGTPKTPPENELIPPPSPPPMVQSLTLPRHNGGEEAKHHSTSKNTWFWRRKKKETQNVENGVSFGCDEEFEASFQRSASVSFLPSASSKSRGPWGVVKMENNFYGSYFSCSAWSIRDVFVFSKRKF